MEALLALGLWLLRAPPGLGPPRTPAAPLQARALCPGGQGLPCTDGRRGCDLSADLWQTGEWVRVSEVGSEGLEQKETPGLEGQGQQNSGLQSGTFPFRHAWVGP